MQELIFEKKFRRSAIRPVIGRNRHILPLEYEKLSGHTACFCKILSALKRFEKKENIRAVLVLPDMEEETIRQYLQEACQAGFWKEQIHMVSEAESLVHFVMSQTSDIWQHRVFLLEFGQEEIRSICLHMNRRTSPMLVQAEEPEYWYVGNLLEGGRDEKLGGNREGTVFRGAGVLRIFNRNGL